MRIKVISWTMCALVFVAFVVIESISIVNAGTIIVPDDYPTIQEAIDAANHGDTVYVRAGTYFEHLTINKALTLQGEDRETTIINGGGSGTVVFLTTDWVNINNLKVINSGNNLIWPHYDSGIELYFSNHTHIENCNVLSNLYGIYLHHSSNTHIMNNNASANSYNGIYLSTSSSNNIISNNIANYNGYSGINIYMDSNSNVISHNIANSNGELGIRIGYSSLNTIKYNTVKSNNYGIYLDQNSNIWIYHNNITYNIHQAWDEDGVNHWDNGYPTGGNYWSDYIGVDNYYGPKQDISGSDEIGDTPYTNIEGGSAAQDTYPLMGPWVIINQPPVADAGPNQTVNEGELVQFNGSASYDPECPNVVHEWDFDANVDSNGDSYLTNDVDATGPIPTHIYDTPGVYTVTLTVTDNDGATDTDTCVITVLSLNQPPVAVAGNDQTVYEGNVVQFNASASYDPDGTIETYEWDFDLSDGLWWETGAVPDAIGPTSIHVYGDDGIYIVTLRVTDNDNLSAIDTCNVTVQNVDPTVIIESITLDIEIGLRVAGRKYNNVSITLYEDGSSIGHVSIERLPGSPNEQIAWIPVSINFSKSYSATVTYTPKDPPNVGANPVWIYIKSQNGSINKIHHTFNVQQSKKRDSEHWNHVEPWEMDLNCHFVGLPFEITSHITDPGSDDEYLTYIYGSQIINGTYLNNPPNLDLYPSPEYNPRHITDTTYLIYEGIGIVTLVVKDDDNIRLGIGEGSDSTNIK